MSKNSAVLLFAALTATALQAQETRLAGPISGMVYDAGARSLRPLLGVPGASYLGDVSLSQLDGAAVSPDGRSVLIAREGKLLLGRGLNDAETSWAVLDQAAAIPELLGWSDDSSWAFAISGRTARAWSSGGEMRSYELPGAAALAAVDSAGRLLAGVDGEGVYVLDGESSRLAARFEKVSALVIAGSTLFAADSARNEILEIRDYAGAAEVLAFAAEMSPVGLALTRDRRELVVASQSERALTSYSIESRERLSRIDLNFEPTRLARLSSSLFLMNSIEAGVPLQLLDTSSTPSVFFVPATRAASEEE